MFDFAFSELALIGVVALVVIGPERLPRVARTAGVVVGRLQRYAATVKADIAREVELSELRRVQGEIKDAAQAFETGVRESLASAETHFQAGQQALMTGPQPAAASVAAADANASAPAAALPSTGNAPGAPVAEAVPAPELEAVRAGQSVLFSPAEALPGNGEPQPVGAAPLHDASAHPPAPGA
ncbi:MAG: twin-arginine translocase subunit TatB [Pseudomonadota bacterium]|nr:twin-arginine translocase subunit TatB [Pseudomonadota bacterium]